MQSKSLLQHHSSKVSILRHSAFFMVQFSLPYMTTGKTIALTRWTFVRKVMSLFINMLCRLGFTHSSVGKESACNSGDPGSIPGLGRSPGERKGYLLQDSWASLVAWLVKNPPAMQETQIRSLGWEDLLEKGKATHSSTLAWRIPCTIQSMGSQRVRHD